MFTYNMKYFSKGLFTNEVSGVSEFYLTRNSNENLFNTKISILRFQRWVLIFCLTFKIIKTSKGRLKKRIKSMTFFIDLFLNFKNKSIKNNILLKRLRLVFYFYVLNLKNNNKIKYLF